jgi:hypothetical protein
MSQALAVVLPVFGLIGLGWLARRTGYVTDRTGAVVHDPQRDHIYTERVARRLSDAYRRDFVIQPTHLAAWAAWEALRARHPGYDTYKLVRLPGEQREVPRAAVEQQIVRAQASLAAYRRSGPQAAPALLDEAIVRFASFHRKRALTPRGDSIRIEGELTLYYRNRLEGHGIA